MREGQLFLSALAHQDSTSGQESSTRSRRHAEGEEERVASSPEHEQANLRFCRFLLLRRAQLVALLNPSLGREQVAREQRRPLVEGTHLVAMYESEAMLMICEMR